MSPSPAARRDRWIACLMATGSFVLYAVTAAPSVATVFDDSLEFQVVLPTLGIAHPSGYPLYTLLGKIWTLLLPLRDPAGRANLLSAFAAALAVGVLYLTARKLSGSPPAAATAAAVFAISPTWWSQATIAEVYSLHGLFVALFLFLLLSWEEAHTVQRPASDRRLALAALTFGLGLAHHRMIALLLPAGLVFIFWTDPFLIRQPKRWLFPLALVLAPLLFYAYLPLRGATVTSLDGTYTPTLRGTVNWVLARGYSVFLTGNPFNVDRQWGDYLALFVAELGAVGLIVALIGLWKSWDFNRRRAALVLLALLAQLSFGAAYKVQDIAVFFIPAFMLMSLEASWGLAPMFDEVARRARRNVWSVRMPLWLRQALFVLWLLPVAAVLLFEPVRSAAQTWSDRNRSQAWAAYDNGQDMLNSAAPGGVIIGLGGETTLAKYFRDVLGERTDLTLIRADSEADRAAAVEKSLAQGRATYLTRDLPGIAQAYSLDAVGPLIAVTPKAAPGPAPAGGQAIGANLSLLSARTGLRENHGVRIVRLATKWAAAAPVPEALKVSVRLLDDSSGAVTANDAAPVHFAYPTTAWVRGEEVDDVYDLPVPPHTPSGSYPLLVILYRASDGSEVGRITLPAVQLPSELEGTS